MLLHMRYIAFTHTHTQKRTRSKVFFGAWLGRVITSEKQRSREEKAKRRRRYARERGESSKHQRKRPGYRYVHLEENRENWLDLERDGGQNILAMLLLLYGLTFVRLPACVFQILTVFMYKYNARKPRSPTPPIHAHTQTLAH